MNEEFIIDNENLELINNSLKFYLKEERITNTDIDNYYSEIKNIYNSSNNDALDRIETEIIMNLETISSNHENNINLIDKRIEHVTNTVNKMKVEDDNYKGGTISWTK